MPQPPYIAIVIEGGLIQTVITEHWPCQRKRPAKSPSELQH
nr:hypothetical protein [Pseudomonas mendocina]